MSNEIKRAMVYKDKTGYWIVVDLKTGEKLGGLHSTELAAYRYANWDGYIVS